MSDLTSLNAGLQWWEGFKDAMTKQTLIREVNDTRLATVKESQVSLLATLNTSVSSAELNFHLTFYHFLWLNFSYTLFAIQNSEMITKYLH